MSGLTKSDRYYVSAQTALLVSVLKENDSSWWIMWMLLFVYFIYMSYRTGGES